MLIYKKEKGMTLVEILLYMSIFVLVFGALFSFLYIFYSNKIKNRTMLEVEQQGQIISMILSQEIRNASSIISPLAGQTDGSLVLEHFDSSKSPMSFSVTGDSLVLSENGNLFNLSSSRVSIDNLVFINNSHSNADMIEFTFDLSYKSNSDRHEYTFSQNFSANVNLLTR